MEHRSCCADTKIQSTEHRIVKALLYPAGDVKSRTVALSCPEPGDDDQHSAPWATDVDVSHWFPHGTRHVRLSSIPATGFQLTNDYTVISSTFQRNAPNNQALLEVLGIHVRGNVLVLRHSSAHPMVVVNIHPAERRLIDLVVQRYVAMFLTAVAAK